MRRRRFIQASLGAPVVWAAARAHANNGSAMDLSLDEITIDQLGAGVGADLLEGPNGVVEAWGEPDVVQDAPHIQQLLVIVQAVAGGQQRREEVGAQGMAVQHL